MRQSTNSDQLLSKKINAILTFATLWTGRRPLRLVLLPRAEKGTNSMTLYVVNEDEIFLTDPIGKTMFGANFVTIYDFDVALSAESVSALELLGIQTLRFPGGSATELQFTEASFLTQDWNAETVEIEDQTYSLTTLNDFFITAAAIKSDVQLVIPTRVAFAEPAGLALANGTYGNRTELRPDYLTSISSYLDHALNLAEKLGVRVTRVEIGNEFWGSGEMTASEYGLLAGKIARLIGERYPSLEISVQMVASANLYSPLVDRRVLLEKIDSQNYKIHFNLDESAPLPTGWSVGVLPGQGNAITQNETIAQGILKTDGANKLIDAAISHVYFDGGFERIDNESDFKLRTAFDRFAAKLDLTDLDHDVTEWGPRNRGSLPGNAEGLEYAHTTIEAFFELASNGVDAANFWPLTFSNPSLTYRTLIDTNDSTLTFGGVAFNWLTSTLGTRAVLDWELAGEIDIHGYADTSRLVLFISERGAAADQDAGRRDVQIDLSEFISGETFFAKVSRMNSDTGISNDRNSKPVVSIEDGFMSAGPILNLELFTLDLAVVEIFQITSMSDTIYGGVGDDAINGDGGDDRVFGSDGNDSLKGQLGNDHLSGQDGNDTLIGGWGNDALYGGTGSDLIYGGQDNDSIVGGYHNDTLHGESGNDTIIAGSGDDYIFGGEGNDSLVPGLGSDTIDGGDGEDTASFHDQTSSVVVNIETSIAINTSGTNFLISVENAFGSVFADKLFGDHRSNRLYGGEGNDTIHGADGADTLDGGSGDDFVFAGYSTNDLRDLVFGGDGNDVIDGGYGNDELHGGSGNDTVIGGFGSDTVVGNDGADSLVSGPSSDVLFGGPGDDTINGGFGSDRLNGGAGADVFFHLGVRDHGSDWVQDYSFNERDILSVGLPDAARDQFQVNYAHTAGAGDPGVAEVFVIYRPTDQILFALVDGVDQTGILLGFGGQVVDLF